MYVVDASVWVSRFVARDVFHAQSRQWIGAMVAAQTILTAPAVLLPEVGGALARQTGRPELAIRALSLLQRLPNLRIAFIEAELALASGELAAQLRMRGADALYVALAERLGVPLVTWDREQRERGSGRVETLTPTEALGATR